jgi:hypothetical protein
MFFYQYKQPNNF